MQEGKHEERKKWLESQANLMTTATKSENKEWIICIKKKKKKNPHQFFFCFVFFCVQKNFQHSTQDGQVRCPQKQKQF